jgi:hypothetical protein
LNVSVDAIRNLLDNAFPFGCSSLKPISNRDADELSRAVAVDHCTKLDPVVKQIVGYRKRLQHHELLFCSSGIVIITTQFANHLAAGVAPVGAVIHLSGNLQAARESPNCPGYGSLTTQDVTT